jgi:hypothetical protein
MTIIICSNNESNTAFSFCMSDVGGYFVVGEAPEDSELINSTVQYTPLHSQTQFMVHVESISVGTDLLNVTNSAVSCC